MTNLKIINWLIVPGLSLLISGCGWKQKDLSSEEPFNAYVGSNYVLKIPMTLREREEHEYRFVPHAIMSEIVDESLGQTVSYLPSGTRVKVNAVKTIEMDGSHPLYILGYVEESNTSDWIEFEILLGSWTDKIWLKRMPWEEESVPESRYIPLDKSKQHNNPYK